MRCSSGSFAKVTEAIREGEVISKPMRDNSTPGFHPLALFFWMLMGTFPGRDDPVGGS